MMIFNQKYHRTLLSKLLVLITILMSISIVTSVRPSKGCTYPPKDGLISGLSPGETVDFKRQINGAEKMTHRLILPSNYNSNGIVPPVFYYFHGLGGDHEQCGDTCERASEMGFVSISMSGYEKSWKHGGSFLWTTNVDSVAQTLGIMEEVENNVCVDLDRIWAVGCSNGGMFTFELAADERTASKLLGIAPIVGLPHKGFSRGPKVQGIHMMGMWGEKDDLVPPISNTDYPDVTRSKKGLYFSTSDKVMMDWTVGNGCAGSGQDALDESEDWGIGAYGNLITCTLGCGEQENGVRVVGCIFNKGHVCNADMINEPIFNFMLESQSSSLDNFQSHDNSNENSDKGSREDSNNDTLLEKSISDNESVSDDESISDNESTLDNESISDNLPIPDNESISDNESTSDTEPFSDKKSISDNESILDNELLLGNMSDNAVYHKAVNILLLTTVFITFRQI